MVKLRCLTHDKVFDSEDDCPDCKERRKEIIRSLRDEGWTDADFIKAGWKNFK
jgi:hypothetical protein